VFFRVENLTKKFGDFVAVNGVSTSFTKNKITAIIGPNGAGKTTFVNLCSGLLKPTDGSVFFLWVTT
jgi:branched-chain amino acid transport system ATP-binding protein